MAEVMVALQQSMALQMQFDSSSQAAGSTGFTLRMQKYLPFGSTDNSVNPDTQTSTKSRLLEGSFRVFSFGDMKLATRNFNSSMSLGRGRYGEVFRGWLQKKTYIPSKSDNGLPIAVKRLFLDKFKPHEIKEIQQKIKIFEELKDPNVVKILGYCAEEDLVLIVYESMHQGTLNDYLFSERPCISRVKIAIGVGRGIVFLRTQPLLADYSVKMQSILLDEEFNAKISDVDMAMLVSSTDARLYLHPSSSYYLKEKDCVLGFGVLLMELLTGEPIDNEVDLTAARHSLSEEDGYVSLPSFYGVRLWIKLSV